jgi:translation initiation factor 2 alpha subunit (eIF-2alpha)
MSNNCNNKNSVKKQQTAKRIIEAIRESQGLLTLAAKKAGVAYSTVWRYGQEFTSVKEAMEEAKERMTDLAEGKLFEKIQAGATTAILFYLKCKGKNRGYIERVEHGGEGGQAIPIRITYERADSRATDG